jgi:hypothetical protein
MNQKANDLFLRRSVVTVLLNNLFAKAMDQLARNVLL